MDYSSLLTSVDSYMNRSDLTSEIPDFIERAEEEMNAFLAQNPVRPMIKTYTLTPSTARVDLPDDFMDALELTATDSDSNSWPLVRLDVQDQFTHYKRALAPGVEYNSSDIQHYKILGDTIVLSATPSSLTLTLDCYTKLTAVTDTNATNWLMSAHGDAYLFGTLAHAAHRIRDYAFRDENKALFQGIMDMVARSYPERKRAIGRRVVDAPWSGSAWNINTDTN